MTSFDLHNSDISIKSRVAKKIYQFLFFVISYGMGCHKVPLDLLGPRLILYLFFSHSCFTLGAMGGLGRPRKVGPPKGFTFPWLYCSFSGLPSLPGRKRSSGEDASLRGFTFYPGFPSATLGVEGFPDPLGFLTKICSATTNGFLQPADTV